MNTRRVWSCIAATAALSLPPFPGIARAAAEYESSEVMVPVRDGIKLHTLLLARMETSGRCRSCSSGRPMACRRGHSSR